MPNRLLTALALLLVGLLGLPAAFADDKAEAALAEAREAVKKLRGEIEAAVDTEAPSSALPLLASLRKRAAAHAEDDAIRADVAYAVRWVYEALLNKEEAAVTDALRAELAGLAQVPDAPDAVQLEYLELLLTDYAEAILKEDSASATTQLERMDALVPVATDKAKFVTARVRAYAYAHYRLVQDGQYDRATAMLPQVREAALVPDATEVHRDRWASALRHEHEHRVAVDDLDAARPLLGSLRALAGREASTPFQRMCLAERLRARRGYARRSPGGEEVKAVFDELRALALREDANQRTRYVYAMAWDDEHARAVDEEDAQARRRAFTAMRATVKELDDRDVTIEALCNTLARELAALFRQKEDEYATVLLGELRELCDEGEEKPPERTLSWGLAIAHRELGIRRSFDRADALLVELGTIAKHPGAGQVHRSQYTWALADAVWDAKDRDRKRVVSADIAAIRQLCELPDSHAWRRGNLIYALHGASLMERERGQLAAANRYIAEAREQAFHPSSEPRQLEMFAHMLGGALVLSDERGEIAEVTQLEKELRELTELPEATQRVRFYLRDAWIDAHMRASEANDTERAAHYLAALRAWLAEPDAKRSEDDRSALAVMLYNEVRGAILRKDLAAVDAGLDTMRALADAPDAELAARAELIDALRAFHYRLVDNVNPRAAELLEELRRRAKGGAAGARGRLAFAQALSWSHAKHGDTGNFEAADRELAEMRAYGGGPEASQDLRERLAMTLFDAVHDTVNRGRKLDLEGLLAEMRVLSKDPASSPLLRLRFTDALSYAIAGVVKKTSPLSVDPDGILRELEAIAARADAHPRMGNSVAYGRERCHRLAIDTETMNRATELLGLLRKAALAQGATTYEKDRYSNALGNTIWLQGKKKQWAALPTSLKSLREVTRSGEDEELRGYLVWGLRCAHYHARWEGREPQADAYMAELRSLAEPAAPASWEHNELANAYYDHLSYELEEPSRREAAEAPMAALSTLALDADEDETAREYLAWAYQRLHKWAVTNNEATQAENALRQLRILARRSKATQSQRNAFADALEVDAEKAAVRDDRETLYSHIGALAELVGDEARTSEAQRESYARGLSLGVIRAWKDDDEERALGYVGLLKELASRERATAPQRDWHGIALRATHKVVLERKGLDAAAPFLADLESYWKAQGDESHAAVRYGMALARTIRVLREAPGSESATALLERLKRIRAAQPDSMQLKIAMKIAEGDD